MYCNHLPSIECYNQYGFFRSELIWNLHSVWNIPEKFHPAIDELFLLKWNREYFQSQLKDGIVISRRGIVFHAVQDTYTGSPIVRRAQQADVVYLSCRVIKPEIETPNIILYRYSQFQTDQAIETMGSL